MVEYEILTSELIDEIASSDYDEPWIFLDESEEYKGCWQIEGLSNAYFLDFEEMIGQHRLVTPIGIEEFLEHAKSLDYRVVFTDDPVNIIEAYEHLKVPPLVDLHSNHPLADVHGFLSHQVIGFNKLIKDESIPGGYVVWDTGAGKTAFIAAAIEYHRTKGHPFDIAVIAVKSHNKIDTARKIAKMIDVEPIIIDGTIQRRYNIYEDIQDRLKRGEQVVVITNYEKFRDDSGVFKLFFKKKNCLFFWDEMPTKLSNPDTQLYRAVKKCLYESFYSKPRPSWMRHWILTATPIENSPSDVHSCVNIVHPGLLGSVREFETEYVAGHSPFTGKPSSWKNLDTLEAKLTHMMHRVSKDDPEVAAMFAEVRPMPITIDWNPKHRILYDKLTGKATELIEELDEANILSMIQVMQMICDAPSMVKESATNRDAFLDVLEEFGEAYEGYLPFAGPKGSEVARTLLSAIPEQSFSDVGHTKLDMWREIITERHPESKILTFSTWASYIFPVWTFWLDKWNIPYVVFDGTAKQKQIALDSFREDPDIRVFISGDAGADSIDIPQANVVINYNIPWKWTTLKQRVGRADRVDSTFDFIYLYNLVMPNSIDERKLAITDGKHKFHTSVFDGKAIDEAYSATLSREDMIYLLTGESSLTSA
jgi:SNF2 family DNA or RNA helicase